MGWRSSHPLADTSISKRYRFPQEATVWGVALSAMTCYTLEMEDGTRLDTVRDVKFLEQGSAGPSRTSRARVLRSPVPRGRQLTVSVVAVRSSTSGVSGGSGSVNSVQ